MPEWEDTYSTNREVSIYIGSESAREGVGISTVEDWLGGDEVVVDATVLCNGLAFFVDGELDDVLDGAEDGLGVLETGGHAVLDGFSGEGAHEVGGVLSSEA